MQARFQKCHNKPGNDPPLVAGAAPTTTSASHRDLGVWIIDVDGAIGAATLRDLEAQNGSLPHVELDHERGVAIFGSAQTVRSNQAPVALALASMCVATAVT